MLEIDEKGLSRPNNILQYFVQGCLSKHFKSLIRCSNSYLGRVSCHKELDLMFQEQLFCTSVPSTNLVLKAIPIEAGQHLCRVFLLKLIVFEASENFQRS